MVDAKILGAIRAFCLSYYLKYGEKASAKSIIGKIIAAFPEIKKDVRMYLELVEQELERVKRMSKEEAKQELENYSKYLPKKKEKEEKKELPPLPGAERGVRMRFAPGPSGPLHIGHSRAAILNDEYVKRYGGAFILRLEDTNPKNVSIEAYEMIPEDLEWLGVKWHEFYVQSDRMEIYYEHAKKLLEMGKAYVCTEDPEKWRKRKLRGGPIPEREEPPEVQLEKWEKMLSGEYEEGEAAMVVKTDLNHPNPAVRDFVAFRIIKSVSHPRTGDKYVVYPTYNFAVAIDDHLMGVTHVLRGKDHLVNTLRQEYVYEHFGWKKPYFYHYGLVAVKDTILKTTRIKEGIRRGEFQGWDDPRLGTLRALRRRGIMPEALRRYWKEVGLKEVDITFSWEILFAYNRQLIDFHANRYFFVWNPVKILVKHEGKAKARLPKHPNDEKRGYREYEVEGNFEVYLCKEDWENVKEGEVFRLKDFMNVRKVGDHLEYAGNDLSILKKGAKIVHWLLAGMPAKVFMPDGNVYEGIAEEEALESIGKVVQFERFGYCRLEKHNREIWGFFAHTRSIFPEGSSKTKNPLFLTYMHGIPSFRALSISLLSFVARIPENFFEASRTSSSAFFIPRSTI